MVQSQVRSSVERSFRKEVRGEFAEFKEEFQWTTEGKCQVELQGPYEGLS